MLLRVICFLLIQIHKKRKSGKKCGCKKAFFFDKYLFQAFLSYAVGLVLKLFSIYCFLALPVYFEYQKTTY